MKHYFKVMSADGKLQMEWRDQLDAVKHARDIKGYVTLANVMIRDSREYVHTDDSGTFVCPLGSACEEA